MLNFIYIKIYFLHIEFYRNQLKSITRARSHGLCGQNFRDPQNINDLLIQYESFQKIIFCSSNANEFIIKDVNKFQEIVLPNILGKKINSFIRQLNMYGFHKARKQNTRSIFSHPYFMRNKQLLPLVMNKLKNSDESLEQNSIQPPKESKKPISVKLIESKSFDTPKTTESSTHFDESYSQKIN